MGQGKCRKRSEINEGNNQAVRRAMINVENPKSKEELLAIDLR